MFRTAILGVAGLVCVNAALGQEIERRLMPYDDASRELVTANAKYRVDRKLSVLRGGDPDELRPTLALFGNHLFAWTSRGLYIVKGAEFDAFEKAVGEYYTSKIKTELAQHQVKSPVTLAVKVEAKNEPKPSAMVVDLTVEYLPAKDKEPATYRLRNLQMNDYVRHSGKEPLTLTLKTYVDKHDRFGLSAQIRNSMIDYVKFVSDYQRRMRRGEKKVMLKALSDAMVVVESHWIALRSLEMDTVDEEVQFQRDEVSKILQAAKDR